MRIHWVLAAAVAVAGLAGCGHEQSSTARSAYGQARDDFAIAYDSVKRGVEESATAGKYALRSAGNGIVQVTDRSKQDVHKAQSSVEDSWIKTKIESKYAVDKEVRFANVNVASDRGIVQLSGAVDDPREAERAIQLALDTKGVEVVQSNLHYRRPRSAPPYSPPPTAPATPPPY